MFSHSTFLTKGVPVLNYHAMKAHGDMEVQLHACLTSESKQWSDLLSDRFNSVKQPSVRIGQETVGATDGVNTLAKIRIPSPAANRTQIQTAVTFLSYTGTRQLFVIMKQSKYI